MRNSQRGPRFVSKGQDVSDGFWGRLRSFRATQRISRGCSVVVPGFHGSFRGVSEAYLGISSLYGGFRGVLRGFTGFLMSFREIQKHFRVFRRIRWRRRSIRGQAPV